MGPRVLIILIFLLPSVGFAQQEPDSLRAYYIQEYPDWFAVWPVLKHRQLSFSIRDKERKKEQVNFYPNNAFTLGFGAYLFDVVIEATFAIPLNEMKQEIYGESSARDLQANILAKKFAADIYYQKYKGFYIEDERTTIPPGTPYPQRPDITTRNFGFGGLYVLDHRKFSLRSAFNYADRQLHSRGSIVIGGALNSFKLEADSAVLMAGSRPDFGDGSSFKELQNTSLSLVAGYSYTWIWKKFFVNGTAAIGPAHNWISYEDSGVVQKDKAFNGITSWRFGIGYNNDRFFAGVGFTIQSRGITFDDMRFSSSSSLFRMVAGYRFREIGILKKRAVDLIQSSL